MSLTTEDLQAIGQLLDMKLEKGLQPINKRLDKMEDRMDQLEVSVKKINITLENDIKPRLQNIEECYLSTYQRYKERTEQIDKIQEDVDVLKRVVGEHSVKLQKIS